MINGDDRLGIHRIRTSRSTRQSDEFAQNPACYSMSAHV